MCPCQVRIKPVPDNLELYYVNLVYNFNLNAHYHIYKSWTFMISTANLTVVSSKAVASLATVHVPSPIVTSAFSRRCIGLPPHAKKSLVPKINKYLCNNIIIVSTKLHPVNRVKNKVEVDNSHYRLFTASNCSALQ